MTCCREQDQPGHAGQPIRVPRHLPQHHHRAQARRAAAGENGLQVAAVTDDTSLMHTYSTLSLSASKCKMFTSGWNLESRMLFVKIQG